MRIVRDLRMLFSLAHRYGTSIVRCMVASALASVLLYAAEWLFIPCVLHIAQHGVSPLEAVYIVVAWTLVLVVLAVFKRYIQTVFEDERDRFRSQANTALARKATSFSYPTAVANETLLKRASAAVGRHIHAPITAMWNTVSALLFDGVGAIGFSIVLFCFNGWLGLLSLCTAIAEAVVHRLVTCRGERFFKEENEQHAAMAYATRVARSSAYVKDVRLFGMTRWICALHERGESALKALFKRRGRLYFLYNAVDVLMTLARNGVAYALLLCAVFDGRLSIAQCVLYFTAISCFTECISGLLTQLWTLRAQGEELAAYHAYEALEDADSFGGTALPTVGIAHTLECRGVTFSYPGEDIPVLKDLNLVIRPHQNTAIVAKDGRASSALALLLCGLCDPEEGQILLDGADVRDLDRRAYYAMLSSVLGQQPLSGISIGEWIGFADPTDETRVWNCLEHVGLKNTVKALPLGLQTPLGRELCDDGVVLSGGQMQRLLLARALFKDADVWILDEPTSALDPLAQSALYEECFRCIGERTAVFLSCRTAVSRLCDRVVYLADGRVAEEGTHEDLMKRDKEYARLFSLQSRYYREGRGSDAQEIG